MSRSKLEKSQLQERESARAHGAVLNPRSGARWDRKNDSRSPTDLIENKRTDNTSSITIKFEDLLALEHHALAEGRYPLFEFSLGGRSYVIRPREDDIERGERSATNPTRRHMGSAPLVQQGKMLGNLIPGPRQSLLRRVPPEREGEVSQTAVPGDESGQPGPLPRERKMSGLRSAARSTGRLRGVGGNLRAGTKGDTEGVQP